MILLTGCFKKDTYESPQDIDLDEYVEDIAMYLESGFLYTSTLDYEDELVTDYFDNRKDAVDLFMFFIDASATSAIATNEGLIAYEEYLLTYMDNTALDTATVNKTLDSIFSYRLLIDTAIYELDIYSGIDNEEQSFSQIFPTTSNLIILEQSYLNYLMNQTAYFSSLEEDLEDSPLYKGANDIYMNAIYNSFGEMLDSYSSAAMTNVYLESSDYYATEYFLDQAKTQLDILEERESEGYIELDRSMDIDDLLDALDALEESIEKPNNLVSSSTGINTVGSSDNYMEDAIKLLSNIRVSDIQEMLDSKQIPDFTTAINARVTAGTNPTSIEPGSIVPITSDEARLNLKAKFSKFRDANEFEIAGAQWTTKNFTALDKQYDKIINAISFALNRYTDELSIKEIEQISNFFKDNLEEVLGDKKQDFIDTVLNTKTSELLDRFESWIITSTYANDQTFQLEDLVTLLIALGIDIAPLPEAIEPEQAADEDNTSEVAVGTPTLTASNWQLYTEAEVLFSLDNTQAGFTYEWHSGESSGTWIQSNASEYIFTYDTPGTYDAQVKIYDTNDALLFTLSASIQVTEGVTEAEGEIIEEITYHDNGNIHIIAHYFKQEDGTKTLDGKWQLYSSDGVLLKEVNYTNGLFDGPYLEYYSDGTLQNEMTYVDNLIEGHAYSYYSNGDLYTDTMYVDGLKHGYYYEYQGPKVLSIEGYYTNDLKDGTWTSYHAGDYTDQIWGIAEYDLGVTLDTYQYNWEGWLLDHRTYVDGVWYDYTVYKEDGSVDYYELNAEF